MAYAWHDAGDGRQVYCKVREPEADKRSALGCPIIIRDEMPPVRSMADGKMYDSKSGIRASYLPSGNPEGIHFTEVGDDPSRLRRHKPEVDRKAVRDSIAKAEAKFKRGQRAHPA